ncbi:MAG: PASTA domain-containing protein [Elusimicrobia bacterium]|nr:PASTA domain-containing protein [Elusimicrobiota bacterium]
MSKKVNKIEMVFMLVVLLVLGAAAVNWALKGAIHYQKEVQVPDLRGKSANEALEMLAPYQLALKKEGSEFNDSIPVGTILRQHPLGGSTVREGKVVRVTLSQGGETVTVPDLVGQSLRSAEISLRKSLLSLGEIRFQPSVKYPKEAVIAQEPPFQKSVSKNSFVHLTVSEGPPKDGTTLMPDFVGKKWEETQVWSKKSGITILRVDDPSSAQSSETVVEQNILPDAALTAEVTVRMVVSTSKTPQGKE